MTTNDMHLPLKSLNDAVDPLLAVSIMVMEERTSPQVCERALDMLCSIYPGTAWALLLRSAPSQYEALTTSGVGVGSIIEVGDQVLDGCATVAVSFVAPAPALTGALRCAAVAGSRVRQPRVALAAWGLQHAQVDDTKLEWLARLFAAARATASEMESLREQSYVDALTGIHNRRGIIESLEREWVGSQRYDTPLSLLFFDIDEFKPINDRHGHAVGDEVLRAVAQRLREEVRGVDLIGRLGGDEFLVLLPRTTMREAEEIGRRLAARINAMPVTTEAGSIDASVTFGAATSTAATSATALLECADKRMLRRKRSSRRSAA